MKERLEKMVRAATGRLEANGVCRLWKIPNDRRITGAGQIVYGEQLPCDFFGHTSDGRIVMVECKDIRQSSLAIGGRGIKPHQLTALWTCRKAGGHALLVWANDHRVVALSPDEITTHSTGRKSVPWKLVSDASVPFEERSLADLIQGRILK